MRRYSSYMVLVLSLTLILSVKPAFSQTAEEFQAQQKEIGALKEGMAGLKKDIEDIKKQLAARPAAPGEFKEAIINIKGAPVMGDKKAKLVLMEFTDYQ